MGTLNIYQTYPFEKAHEWQAFRDEHEIFYKYADVHISKCRQLSYNNLEQGMRWYFNPRNLLIQGRPGTGKTTFALALAREAVRKFGARDVCYVNAEHISHMQKYLNFPILFIDDVAKKQNPWIHDVVCKRFEKNLVTVLITEKEDADLQVDLKKADKIIFNGPDLRSKENGFTCSRKILEGCSAKCREYGLCDIDKKR
jgi:hypothetical protein